MINHLIFDIDDTIYSQSCNMSAGVRNRIVGYCAKFFNTDFEQALKDRNKALNTYDTTLEYLKANGLKDIEDYFAFVHPAEEISELEKDSALRPLLESIKMPKVVLTNAPSEHAEHVLNFLEVRDLFCNVISDIRRNHLKGKPFDFSYKDALYIVGGTLKDTLFLDDDPIYIKGYLKLGGFAALVGKKHGAQDFSSFGGHFFTIETIHQLPELLKRINGE